MKLSDKLNRIRAVAPKRSEYAQLYRAPAETRKRFKRITLYTLFISEEATHLLRNHVFDSQKARTPAQWHEWFGELVNERDGSRTEPRTIQRLTYIHTSSVLPGLAIRTAKSWAVQSIIGWVGGAKKNAMPKSHNSSVAKRRHKAKQKRKTNG